MAPLDGAVCHCWRRRCGVCWLLLRESKPAMRSLPNPRALLMDVRAIGGSTKVLYQPPRLPDAPPDVQTFWAECHVSDSPLPDLDASLRLLETTEAGIISAFTFP